MPKRKIIILPDKSAYLPGVQAAVTMVPKQFIADSETEPIKLHFKDKKLRRVVPWGDKNNLPAEVLKICSPSPIVMAGLPFNINMTYGDGITYGRIVIEDNKRKFVEANDVKEINEFFENNDIGNYYLEQCNDACWFYNLFPEVILNKDRKKIVSLVHKEATFSRWEEMNPETGMIEHHFYYANWLDPKADEIKVTSVLCPHRTVEDLKIRTGLVAGKDGKKEIRDKDGRYIVPLNIPTPGKNYYQKPYWYSIMESGWLEYSKQIPEFKSALLNNAMAIKYHVELSDDYFDKIFRSEGITEDKARVTRIKQEYDDLNKFLSNNKNSGKSVISFVKYDPTGKEVRRMRINVINNRAENSGGEYIQDSEEVSNIISYALGVHPSLIGSSPGKNKTISGTEARELFIIKQALVKHIRDRLLRPLYIIKAFNGWPDEIEFAVPNLVLTTLDRGTGSEKVIS